MIGESSSLDTRFEINVPVEGWLRSSAFDFVANGPVRTKSSRFRHNYRFMIAWHSPDEVLETGLLGCPPKKKAAKLAGSNEQDTFSGPL
jgi:hypothetical protein